MKTIMYKFLIFLVLAGVFAIAAPTLAANGTISGTVTHAVGGTAINGIYLSALNVDTGVLSYVFGTDAAGAYTFTLAPGTYDISPYTTVAEEANVLFIKKTTTTILASGEAKTGINFALTRRGKFSGHVYSSDGVTPVTSATVSLQHISGSTVGFAYATTTSTGSYIAMPTPSGDTALSSTGSYSFFVTRTGYYGATLSGVSLSADETTVTQNINLTPGSTVGGTIRNASGAALPDATVILSKIGGGTYTAQTNASGTYSVSIYDLTNYGGSAVADYTLSVSKAGYVTKTASVSITADGATLTGNDITLATSGIITGTISSAGVGLSGVLVVADDGYGNTSSATTDANGAFTLTSLNPSTRYTLTATKTNYVGQKMYNVTVTGGSTTAGENFTLPAANTFSGYVFASGTNAPLQGAVVSLFKRNRTRSEVADYSYTTKGDGSFLFRNVSPGKYRVTIVKNGYVKMVVDTLTLKSSLTGKTYKLEAAGTILGRLTSGTTGVASADIAVFALQNGKEVSYSATTSDENGNYLISGLKKGTYRLKITSTEFVAQVFNVKVAAGAPATKNVKLAVAGSVSGFITDKVTGLPVSATIKVVGTAIIGFSDFNGFYVIDGVTPGKRKLTVVHSFYEVPAQKGVVVNSGRTKTGINFSLTPKQ